MSREPAFIPGRPLEPGRPLGNYRPHQPVGAVGDYVRKLTAHDELVVDLFCQGPRFVREALQAGRRVVGFSVNPILLHAARLGLTSLAPGALDAAFTRLADTAKGDTTLRKHIISLYRARCPVCRAPGTAEWFAWSRDADRPFEKGVRCQACIGLQVGPTDEEDVALAHSFAERRLAYYYALDRAAPLDHPARRRAAELVDCYTPRNLSALMDLTRHLDDAKPERGAGIILRAGLLNCFDRCSKLYPDNEDRPRPRALRIPVRYLERNVWFCFEDEMAELAEGGSSSSAVEPVGIDALLRGGSSGYTLISRAARDVPQLLPPASVDLILVDPPRPDGVFWALSALWSAWLWDTSEARAMRPFLRRRRFDWRWHWQALRRALRGVGPCLTDGGLLIMLFPDVGDEMLSSVSLAAASAGYDLHAWGYAPEIGYRLTWSWHEPERPVSPDLDALDNRLVSEVEAAALETLRARGEPSPARLVRAAAHAHLVDRNLLSSLPGTDPPGAALDLLADALAKGLQAAPIAELDEPVGGNKLWLASLSGPTLDTLADNVERTLRHLVVDRLVWRESDLINEVYASFPGPLSPDLTLVRVCIASYGVWDDQEIRLRREDDLERRESEIGNLRQDLIGLGRRLGFQAGETRDWDVCWRDDDEERYLFLVAATGILAPHLLNASNVESEARRCLVIPGGRAKLIDLKLRRDPRLAHAVRTAGWQFVKFRHLRRLMTEEGLDRYAFRTVLGLDPIVEQERTQLTLF